MELDKALTILNLLVPEATDLILKRYNVLRTIKNCQPIGRRLLAINFGVTERVLRSETDRLREFGLVNIESSGMSLSELGERLINDTELLIHRVKGLSEVENAIKDKLGIKKVCIVEGDYAQNNIVKKDVGRKAAEIIVSLLTDNMRIGIMGGTTMALIANEIHASKKFTNLLIVPGRGGLGENLEIQANSIAAKMAHNLGAEYKLLHVPDNIGPDVLKVLQTNTQIKNVLDEIKKIDMIIFGIGTAEEMTRRRGLSEIKKDELKMKKAFAEALGYYFNRDGEPVLHTDSVGIDLSDLKNIRHAICVAAGASKAEAIYSFSKYHKDYTLVTDEVTAKEILNIK